MPCATCRCLKAFATRGIDLRAMHLQRHAERAARRFAMCRPSVGLRLQSVVHVDRMKSARACPWILRQPVQQHRRIPSATERHPHSTRHRRRRQDERWKGHVLHASMLAVKQVMCSRSHRIDGALTVREPASGDDGGVTDTKENA